MERILSDAYYEAPNVRNYVTANSKYTECDRKLERLII